MPVPALLQCDACGVVLGGEVVNTFSFVACPSCGASIQAEVFPAFFRSSPPAAPPAEPLVAAEDAGCFFHPTKKAVVPCGRCGRFLCATCDLEVFADQHLCPECLAKGRAAAVAVSAEEVESRRALEGQRVFYDKLALSLAGLPLLLPFFGWFMTIVTAPAAFVVGLLAWPQPPRSLVPRTRWRVILALLLASVLSVVWMVLIYKFFDNLMTVRKLRAGA